MTRVLFLKREQSLLLKSKLFVLEVTHGIMLRGDGGE